MSKGRDHYDMIHSAGSKFKPCPGYQDPADLVQHNCGTQIPSYGNKKRCDCCSDILARLRQKHYEKSRRRRAQAVPPVPAT